ncbi:MAG: aspartate kinase, partial [Crocinitomicaceae bacterium]
MKVFKFGGASVKDAAAVKNVVSILHLYKGEKLGVVISAMGKTTNAMEEITKALLERNRLEFDRLIEERKAFHLGISNELFDGNFNSISEELTAIFDQLTAKFEENSTENADLVYDQIVSLGEVLSTKIVCAYIDDQGIAATWMDARKLIRTNNKHREAEVDWEETTKLFQTEFLPTYKEVDVIITQGFIGHTSEGFTTTIGREGSDFSAGIIAYCCLAESVTIWKDVPGMLNADPKWFDNTVKLDRISFREAIELAYYGASVIHPKT